jgi:hypothetical protein
MPGLPIIDYVFRSFVEGLPISLQPGAVALAFSLGLTATPDVPWSQVFPQEVTLGLPLLLTEGMPRAEPAMVHHATMAHGLAVIGAFCEARIKDMPEAPSRELRAVLDAIFLERDRSMAKLGRAPELPEYVFSQAAQTAASALTMERVILVQSQPCDFAAYDHVTMEKHYRALPAGMMLGRAAGLSGERQSLVLEVLMGIALGLQIRADVQRWEDDYAEGGSWVICLAKDLDGQGDDEPSSLEDARRRVNASDVLVQFLDRSQVYLRIAKSAAQALGMHVLAGWAEREELASARLAEHEARVPGYVVWRERILEADRRSRRALASLTPPVKSAA